MEEMKHSHEHHHEHHHDCSCGTEGHEHQGAVATTIITMKKAV